MDTASEVGVLDALVGSSKQVKSALRSCCLDPLRLYEYCAHFVETVSNETKNWRCASAGSKGALDGTI